MVISYTEDSDAGPAYKPLSEWDFNKAAGEFKSQHSKNVNMRYFICNL